MADEMIRLREYNERAEDLSAVILAKSFCRQKCISDIPGFEHAKVTCIENGNRVEDAFVNLVDSLEEDVAEALTRKAQDDLAEANQKLFTGIDYLLFESEADAEALESQMVLVLDENSRCHVYARTNIGELLGEEEEKLRYKVEGLLEAFNGFYSAELLTSWQFLIGFMFTDPEHCNEYVRDNYMDEEE